MRTGVLSAVVVFLAVGVGVWRVRSRRSRRYHIDTPLSERWRDRQAYDRSGDDE
jgi:hypothetical protein